MSYIATVAATVTRSADAASMTGTNFSSWYNQGEGALYVELVPSALAAANGIVVNDNTTSNRIRLATTSTSDQCTITATGTAQAVLDGGTPVANTTMKLAMAYQVNNFALSLGGASVATDTAGVTPIVVSKRKTATRSPTSTTSISSAQSTNPRAGPLKPTKAPCRRWLPLMAGMLTCGCYTTPIQVRLTRTLFPLKRL
jgi:phospholipase/lecithinase/hemolysin